MLTPANMLSDEAIAPEPDAHTHSHTTEIEDLALDFTTTTTQKPQRVPPRPDAETRSGYSRLNTSRRVLAVKSRFSHVALTFAVVKQHFCWLTVPPCYSRCANQCWVFIWLVAAILPHTKTTSRGSGQEQVTYLPGVPERQQRRLTYFARAALRGNNTHVVNTSDTKFTMKHCQSSKREETSGHCFNVMAVCELLRGPSPTHIWLERKVWFTRTTANIYFGLVKSRLRLCFWSKHKACGMARLYKLITSKHWLHFPHVFNDSVWH